jgi:hypothetical protein
VRCAATLPGLPATAAPVWGEWFAGTIDELNVCSRALTTAEIAVDMNAS